MGIALLFAGSAAAQVNSGGSLALPPQPVPQTNAQLDLAMGVAPASAAALSPAPVGAGLALPVAPEAAEPAEPQTVQGVFQNFYWQAYLGYTYVRFFEVPGTQVNTNGLNFSAVYYFKDWLAADGEFVGTYGTQLGQNANFLMGMGGIRVRHAMEHNMEVWAHVLGGAAHYSPQTAFGKQTSVGYEIGGGLDLNTHRRRLAYRISVDAAGTAFFNTYQLSPKVSAGIVFKF